MLETHKETKEKGFCFLERESQRNSFVARVEVLSGRWESPVLDLLMLRCLAPCSFLMKTTHEVQLQILISLFVLLLLRLLL